MAKKTAKKTKKADTKRASADQSKSKEITSVSEIHEPQEMPAEIAHASTVSAPTENPPDDVVELDTYGGGESAPLESPPNEAAAADDAFGAGVWHKNKKITALWSKAENRNSWIAVEGLGWKKLANNSDSVVVALTMLNAHAKQMNCNTNLREDGNKIKEIYVW